MFKKLILGVSLSVSILCAANVREVINVGNIYDFAEIDGIDGIALWMDKNKDYMETKIQEWRDFIDERWRNVRPGDVNPEAPTLPSADKNNIKLVDLTFELTEDLKDQYGNVLYPKGTRINPADYMTLPFRYVVINAEREEELEWLQSSEAMANIVSHRVVLADGLWHKASKKLNRPIFYMDVGFQNTFQITKTPSIISQKGNLIEVQEVSVKEWKEKNLAKKYDKDILKKGKAEIEKSSKEFDKQLQEIEKNRKETK